MVAELASPTVSPIQSALTLSDAGCEVWPEKFSVKKVVSQKRSSFFSMKTHVLGTKLSESDSKSDAVCHESRTQCAHNLHVHT